MKIPVDDWHFKSLEGDCLVVDLYLLNGQHAILEAHPMKDEQAPDGDIPEMVVTGEMPGEKVHEEGMRRRWIARPPSASCEWSHVELSGALLRQIQERLHSRLLKPY